jgi:(R,R)-butanediol dehydrogenase / meso-butanediol dehydrogenase / diacetyl reductase
MDSDVLVVYAKREPMAGIIRPGSHQTYRYPRLAMEKRSLGALSPHHIRVQMMYAGVCGTDLHLLQQDPHTGYIKTSSPTFLPVEGRIFGHEGIGRILDVGANIHHLQPGAYAAFESIVACHHCERCRQGQFNQCRNSALLGMEQDGLFATIADVPACLAHDVSALVHTESDLQALACLEPAGVALVACRNGKLQPGQRVVIFGAGPIGLYCAILARTVFAAGSIHIVEPAPFRRKFAARWANHVHTPEEFFASPLNEIDLVVEASGCLANLDRILPGMNANSHIVALARSGEPLLLNGIDHLITNAISFTGSRGHLGGAFHTLLTLYRQGLFHPEEIVTDVLDGVSNLAQLLGTPDHVVQNSCKVLVKLNPVTLP